MKQRDHLKVVDNAFRPNEVPLLTLPEQDAKLFAEIVGAYSARRLGALRHKELSVRGDLAQVQNMLEFTGRPPWMWSEEDFDQWCSILGVEKKVAVATQRKYQNAIKNFLAYVVDNVKFRNEIHRLYGIYPVQICHSENCIPHLIERELTKDRQALSHDQINNLFSALDEAILEAEKFGSKDFRPLQRDKALFFSVYAQGLRASEALGLNIVSSFQPNPYFPEFGNYGYFSVWGKGSRGSGPKHRMVPVTLDSVPKLLDWYISQVRPHFLRKAEPNEVALFLSERGKRMGISTFEERFQHALRIAGLDGMDFTPHCLRHSSVTHESLRYSTEAVRIKHGHVFLSTTQGYNHTPDDFVRDEINRGIAKHLDVIQGIEQGDKAK